MCFCGFTADAAENGIVSFLSAVYSDTGYEQQGKYELKKKNGKITEIIRLAMGVKGRRPFERYIFEYTDTEISPSRYSLMINYFIADGGVYIAYKGTLNDVNETGVAGRIIVNTVNKTLYILHVSYPRGLADTYADGVYNKVRHSMKLVN